MSRKQLTSKQHSFLEFLDGHIRSNKVWPTYREIVDYFGYRSPNSVTQNLQALAKKGYLTRDHSGYQLADLSLSPAERTGIPIRGVLTANGVNDSETEGAVTLRTVFPNLERLVGFRLAAPMSGSEADEGDVLLLSQDQVGNGELCVALHHGEISLCHHYRESDGSVRLERLTGGEPIRAIENGSVRVLGRYAGHLGRMGMLRSPELFSA
jgi:repressor LexA